MKKKKNSLLLIAYSFKIAISYSGHSSFYVVVVFSSLLFFFQVWVRLTVKLTSHYVYIIYKHAGAKRDIYNLMLHANSPNFDNNNMYVFTYTYKHLTSRTLRHLITKINIYSDISFLYLIDSPVPSFKLRSRPNFYHWSMKN